MSSADSPSVASSHAVAPTGDRSIRTLRRRKMSLLVKWNAPSKSFGHPTIHPEFHVSRTERPSGQRPVPVDIGVYAGAVRDHQALMFRKVLFTFCVLATLCVAALI